MSYGYGIKTNGKYIELKASLVLYSIFRGMLALLEQMELVCVSYDGLRFFENCLVVSHASYPSYIFFLHIDSISRPIDEISLGIDCEFEVYSKAEATFRNVYLVLFP
jgi:hypothetical protein